eukprot:c8508_g1_i1.p1 GENE.c8508_g1_i1~~c8508_g1_i1.p1  ORF type:complete len:186 (+),score=35.91 c8508_g1_i1:338-895(+)
MWAPSRSSTCAKFSNLSKPMRCGMVDHHQIHSHFHMSCVCVRLFCSVRNDKPAGLVRMQNEVWDPLVEFTHQKFGIRPVVTTELVKFQQNHQLVDLFQDLLTDFEPFEMTCVHSLVNTSKSLIVALAVRDGFISAREAATAALVEESFQIQQCGLVEGYHDLFLAKTQAKIAAASIFLHLLKKRD